MDAGAWCDSDDGNVCWRRCYSGRKYDRLVSYKFPVNGSSNGLSKTSIWRLMWRKMKKEKKRIFDCSNSMRFSYDPHSYSQNFDEGSVLTDADDLSRSFSARFAVPSRIFTQNEFNCIIDENREFSELSDFGCSK